MEAQKHNPANVNLFRSVTSGSTHFCCHSKEQWEKMRSDWCIGLKLAQDYKADRNFQDLEAALKIFETVLDFLDRDSLSQKLAWCCNIWGCLAELWCLRYERSAELSDINSAVQYAQQAVKYTPMQQQQECSERLQKLASTLRYRYEKLSQPQDIKDAVRYAEEALRLTEGRPEHYISLQVAAWVHRIKYEGEADAPALDLAIAYYEQAANAALAQADNAKYVRCILGLSVSLGYRYQQNPSVHLTDLEKAIEHDRQLLRITSPHHPDRSTFLQNLASSLHDHYKCKENPEDLESAIVAIEEAVNKMERQDPYRPECLQNKALYLSDRYANAQLSQPNDLEVSYHCYRDSFEAPFEKCFMNPPAAFEAALRWASLAYEHGNIECLTAYSVAFKMLPQIFFFGNSLHTHRRMCQRINITQATSDAINACIKYSNLECAVELAEQGLATFLQQCMQLKVKHPNLLSKTHEEKLQRLSSLICGNDTSTEERRQAATQRDNLIKEIRKNGSKNFLRPKSYKQICNASMKGPVVILNAHQKCCDAIILLCPSRVPVHIPLPLISYNELVAKQKMVRNVRAARHMIPAGGTYSGDFDGEFSSLLCWLKTHLITPIFKKLEEEGFARKTRLWWCPTGRFRELPLHAADDRGCFIHSYTVTLGALSDAWNSKKHWVRSQHSPLSMGIIGVTKTGAAGENNLHNVETEINKIVSLVTPTPEVLRTEEATTDAVLDLLPKYPWVHFAGHAQYNLENPGHSGLKLYEHPLHGSQLTLDMIVDLHLPKAEFVFLAACDTMKGDHTVINESLHLGGGFIAAGFKGAIGTLWSMADKHGPALAQGVYGHLFKEKKTPEVLDVAEALQKTVQENMHSGDSPWDWVPFIHMGV
ncbi:CHAT domain-containing protein [Mycena polygramma]|nr:CHAT domain-containing protein [Mycena polygramma]